MNSKIEAQSAWGKGSCDCRAHLGQLQEVEEAGMGTLALGKGQIIGSWRASPLPTDKVTPT